MNASSNITIVDNFEHTQLVATQLLQRENLLGFDTETTVPNTKSHASTRHISLIQLSNGLQTWLFRMNRLDTIPPALKRLLTATMPVKVGVGLDNDFARLEREYDFRPYGFIDLQLIALSLGRPGISFDDLCSWVGIAPSHDPHEGDWDRPMLTAQQLAYAAYDAEACVTIYRKIFDVTICRTPHENDVPTEEDKARLIEWVNIEIQRSPNARSLESLINQAVNSYGPWRNRWISNQRRDLITETLYRARDTDRIYSLYPGSVPNESHANPLSLPEVSLDHWFDDLSRIMRDRVSGLSTKSAVNMLVNGYGPWAAYPKSQRSQWASQAWDRWRRSC